MRNFLLYFVFVLAGTLAAEIIENNVLLILTT